MDPVTTIVLAGGGLFVASKALERPTVTASAVKGASPIGKVVSHLAAVQGRAAAPSSAGVKNPYVAPRASTYLNSVPVGTHPTEHDSKVMAKAKAEFEKLSNEAKTAACKKLKATYPNSAQVQALDCGAPVFQNIIKAAAAAAGTAGCIAISPLSAGATAAVSPLCGAVAAWITGWAGPKLEQWSKDIYGKVEEFADDAVDVAGDAIGSLKFW